MCLKGHYGGEDSVLCRICVEHSGGVDLYCKQKTCLYV